MADKRMRLREGQGWIELRLLNDEIAKVEDGNVLDRGDLVQLPEELDVELATAADSEGNSVLSPFDLQLTFSSFTLYYPQHHEGSSPLLGLEDPHASREMLKAELAIDDRDAMVRMLSEKLSRPESGSGQDNGERRRRSDAA